MLSSVVNEKDAIFIMSRAWDEVGQVVPHIQDLVTHLQAKHRKIEPQHGNQRGKCVL